MVAYKTKELLDNNEDFSAINSEKQAQLISSRKYNFNLAQAVETLKQQTGNFTIENETALALDQAIFDLVIMHHEAKEPARIAVVDFPDTEDVKMMIDALQAGQEIIDGGLYDNDEEKQSMIEAQNMGLELLSAEIGRDVTMDEVVNVKFCCGGATLNFTES